MNKKMHALGVAIIAAIVYLLVFILAFTPVITTRGTQKLGIISGRILLNTADLDEDDYDDLREDLEDDIADVDDASIVSLVKICKYYVQYSDSLYESGVSSFMLIFVFLALLLFAECLLVLCSAVFLIQAIVAVIKRDETENSFCQNCCVLLGFWLLECFIVDIWDKSDVWKMN